MIRQVHVYSIIAEMVLEVEADSEREALDSARQMAEGRPASEWKPAGVSTVALIYLGNREGHARGD